MKLSLKLTLLFAALLIWNCGNKYDLPTAANESDPVTGAGVTSYIRISPDWDASNGYEFSNPWDIIVGADGYLFIADHTQPSIHVISASGDRVVNDAFGNKFGALTDLTDADGLPVFPVALHQDNRLNLFIADSSNRLMVWNQYLNNVGVDSVANAVELRSPTDDLLWVQNSDSIATLQSEGWVIESIGWSTDNLDYWLEPRLFWDVTDSLEAIQINRYFVDPEMIRITGVSADGDICYVADANSNSILGLQYVPVALLKTGVGDEVLVYSGKIVERSVSSGTGNGTVNDPRGMTHGKDGALYYTQWGENFGVHKIGGDSGFEYGEDDIMEIERFSQASDIALDPIENIYVADTGHDRIQQFNTSGRFTFNIGMSRVFVDSTIVDTVLIGSSFETVTRDTSYQVEVADVLDGPRSVAVDATGIVYIADTGNDRIMRYRLSTELDYTEDH